MSAKIVNVNVEWQGYMAVNLFEGLRYVAVSKFLEDDWNVEAWSIVLDFIISPKQQGNPSKALAHFLVPSALQERLSKGRKFELYAARGLSAYVEIIE